MFQLNLQRSMHNVPYSKLGYPMCFQARIEGDIATWKSQQGVPTGALCFRASGELNAGYLIYISCCVTKVAPSPSFTTMRSTSSWQVSQALALVE